MNNTAATTALALVPSTVSAPSPKRLGGIAYSPDVPFTHATEVLTYRVRRYNEHGFDLVEIKIATGSYVTAEAALRGDTGVTPYGGDAAATWREHVGAAFSESGARLIASTYATTSMTVTFQAFGEDAWCDPRISMGQRLDDIRSTVALLAKITRGRNSAMSSPDTLIARLQKMKAIQLREFAWGSRHWETILVG